MRRPYMATGLLPYLPNTFAIPQPPWDSLEPIWTAPMPSPGDPARPQLPPEDALLGPLIDTLEGLDRSVRGQFLKGYLKTVTQLDFTETQSLEFWEQILTRCVELAEHVGRPISLKTALVDLFSSAQALRAPVLIEFDELKKLQMEAATDSLTGLYNRRLFDEYFDKELNRARRYNHSMAVVIMDLHRFKEVNDRYGHPKGDALLQTTADTLRKSLRSSDYAFRIGGDEFAVLLPQADREQAIALSRRVRTTHRAAIEPLALDFVPGLDYGLAMFPEDASQKEALIRVADERLYQLKHFDRLQPRPPRPPAQPSAQAPPSPPAVAPVEEKVEEKAKAEEKPPEAAPGPGAGEVTPSRPPRIRDGEERRKWDRVSLTGTRAYAQLGETPEKIARVLDLGAGGAALQTESPEEVAETFQAVLHVPILPPVRVSLRRIYELRIEGKGIRIGCAFES